eukprot:3613891-Pyramimonas_sp.AAC.1
MLGRRAANTLKGWPLKTAKDGPQRQGRKGTLRITMDFDCRGASSPFVRLLDPRGSPLESKK